MALGIETNTIAPALIQDNGRALVQSIRQMGEQISGHLTEIQTRRDLASLAQDLQGANPQSADFPVQLTQIASRHPMAVRDERGQMAMSILGKAHGAWQASENDAMAFNRQMALQGYRQRAASAAAEKAEEARGSRPVSVYGVGLVDPLTGETIVPEGSRGGAGNAPKTLSPGSILVDPSGKKIAENPRLPSGSEARLARKDRISAINREIDQFDSDIASTVKQYEESFKRELEAKEGSPEQKQFRDTKTELGKIADQLKTEKKKRMQLLEKIRDEEQGAMVEPELGVVPENAASPVQPSASVLPPAGIVSVPSPQQIKRVRVLDPTGRPMLLREDQVDAAVQNGWKLR